MSDKARKLYPIPVVFTSGEMPTSGKLNGISSQARSGLTLVEQMLGDLWNQAGDPILSPTGNITANALRIPNLARTIGQTHQLNSTLPTLGSPTAFTYTDDVGNYAVGQQTAYLRYPVLSGTPTLVSGAPLIQGQLQSSPTAVNSTGDWYIDSHGKLWTYDGIPSALSIKYIPRITGDTEDTGSYDLGSWNVIPDPSTWSSGNYRGLKISYANGVDATAGYHLWLPPRRALNSPRVTLRSPDATFNVGVGDPDTVTPLTFFQDPTADAAITNGDHYRYNLPSQISTATTGDILPGNFLYLWDEEKGTIVEGITFKSPTTNKVWKVVAEDSPVADLATLFSTYLTSNATQLPADYTTRFKLIVSAVSLTEQVSVLTRKFENHYHSPSQGNMPAIHNLLEGLVTPQFDAFANPNYPSSIPGWLASNWTYDDHPQYLHRAGSTGGGGTTRDPLDNAMLNKFIVSMPDGSNQFGVDVSTLADITFIYFDGLNGASGDSGLSFDNLTGRLNYQHAGDVKVGTFEAANFAIIRDDAAYIANNLAFKDDTGASYHSSLQAKTFHGAAFREVKTTVGADLGFAGSNGYRGTQGSTTVITVSQPVHLPNGARILGIAALGEATTSSAPISVTLESQDFITPTQTILITASTSSVTPVIFWLPDSPSPPPAETAPVLATIDNMNLSYYLSVILPHDNAATGRSAIYSVIIYFVMPNLQW